MKRNFIALEDLEALAAETPAVDEVVASREAPAEIDAREQPADGAAAEGVIVPEGEAALAEGAVGPDGEAAPAAQEVVEDIPADEELEVARLETDRDQADITEIGDTIEEGEGIAEVVDDYAEQLEEGPVADDTVRAMEVAVEHFRKRLNYPKKVMPSLEAFNGKKRHAVQQQALVNLQQMSRVLNKNLVVAQEGLLTRIGNMFSRVFTSYKTIAAKTPQIVQAIQAKGLKEQGHPDAAWGRIFAASGKTTVSAADVEALLNSATSSRTKLLNLLHQAQTIQMEAAQALRSSSFIANDAQVAKINALHKQGMTLKDEFEQSALNLVDKKAKVNVEALQAGDVQKLATAIATLTKSDVVDKFDKMSEKIFKAYDEIRRARRLAGRAAADIRAYRGLLEDALDPIYELCSHYWSTEIHLVHGAYKYLAASVK